MTEPRRNCCNTAVVEYSCTKIRRHHCA